MFVLRMKRDLVMGFQYLVWIVLYMFLTYLGLSLIAFDMTWITVPTNFDCPRSTPFFLPQACDMNLTEVGGRIAMCLAGVAGYLHCRDESTKWVW